MIGVWSARSCAWSCSRLDSRFSGVAAEMVLLQLICGVCAVLMTFDALARLFFRSM